MTQTHKHTFLRSLRTADKKSFIPILFDLKVEESLYAFEKLLADNPHLTIHNEIISQLEELVKTLEPSKKFNTNELAEEVEKLMGKCNEFNYGNWFYYPWSGRVVHMLPEKEFVLCRTGRNVYKITPQERDLLSQKKIGVIGLSVGQSVALTIAMERIASEIRLADFDILELSNLNRIRTGVHTIGIKKVHAVAREISEIDPYLKVICFEEGLNETNLDDFFIQGGPLDLLIEESDGFDIKILSRMKAKQYRIPVLMEASDRCMVDVERFDIEPERPILHGLVKHLDIEVLKSLKTNEDKIPYMLDILGIDTCSARLKASMIEIEQTINTWPQLASAVTMGGGITADVARRLLLNQFTDSGRYHVDVEQLIGNKENTVHEKKDIYSQETYKEKSIQEVKEWIIQNFSPEFTYPIPEFTLKEIVEAAILAPSGGNAQPWFWFSFNSYLFLLNPYEAHHSILGFKNRALYYAQGAAIENLIIKASELGFEAKIEYFPEKIGNPQVIAQIHFKAKTKSYFVEGLAKYIPIRLTNRANGERQAISQNRLEQIFLCVEESEASLEFITDNKHLDLLKYTLSQTERIRILEEMGHRDFVNEIRWSREEAFAKKDGIELPSIELKESEKAGLFVARSPEVISLLRSWNLGNAFTKLTSKNIDSASAIGILRITGTDPKANILAGRIVERIWLQAAHLGLSFQPVSASVFMYQRVLEGNGEGVSEFFVKELLSLQNDYLKSLHQDESKDPIAFIFRLSKAETETMRSIRKPIDEVMEIFNHQLTVN
jgi:molybdopterin/thiamine biosynthesis adenylyltransferase